MPAKDAMVFVVDDDQSVREALSGLIRAAGWRCELFASGAAFLSADRPDTTSCLVLDVCIPGISGLELPTELERRGVSIPIVFITGRGTIPMSVRAMKGGAVEF